MTCNIEWNTLPATQWCELLDTIDCGNLLQSQEYNNAQRQLNQQKQRLGLIKIKGQAAGLVQVLEAGILANFVHAVIIDRGPLWFEGFGSLEDFEGFVKELNGQFPRRLGRRRRFIPEIEDSPQVREILARNGFRHVAQSAYQTIRLDLNQSLEELRAGLKKNWRGALKKAEKAGLDIEWDEQGQHLPWLLKAYALDKQKRGYDGPDPKRMQIIAQEFVKTDNLIIGRALINNKPIAAILVPCHGRGATYQIGWSSQTGRQTCAHYLLLWQLLRKLKNKGIIDLDLGGVNDETAKGVKSFKSGMGGHLQCLPGLYT